MAQPGPAPATNIPIIIANGVVPQPAQDIYLGGSDSATFQATGQPCTLYFSNGTVLAVGFSLPAQPGYSIVVTPTPGVLNGLCSWGLSQGNTPYKITTHGGVPGPQREKDRK